MSKKLILYRGITVSEAESDSVIEDIKNNGLYATDKQRYIMKFWKDLRKSINALYDEEDLKIEHTRPPDLEVEEYTCFADIIGAKYYATKHNITKTQTVPILITLELDIENICIDGRDFLSKVFSLIDFKDTEKTLRQTEKLKFLFGNKIEKYVDKGLKHPKSEKMAIYDLTLCDEDIIMDHSKNSEIIGGLYNTTFKSSFFGKIPIAPETILSVEKFNGNFHTPRPTVTLEEFKKL